MKIALLLALSTPVIPLVPAALATAAVQDDQPAEEPAVLFQRHFDAGIQALNDGENDKGIAEFQKCLDIAPESPIPAYNIACGHALEERKDEAFAWLDKAADWGYGNSAENIEHAESKDADLTILRDDERFPKFIEKMRASLAALEKAAKEEWSTPAIHVPEALAENKKVGALVVLHDAGKRKSDALDAWKEHADRLGLVLIAPSGKFMAGGKLEQGMTWFTDFESFQSRYWTFEESVEKALDAAKKRFELDAARTYIVGEGQGAMIAFNAAMRAPRLYAGVLMVDGFPIVPLVESYAPNAKSAGLDVRWLANTKRMFGVPPDQTAMVVGQFATALARAQLGAEVDRYAPNPEKPELRDELIVTALDAMVGAKAATVEAGSDK